MNIEQYLSRVPDYKTFYTVDELARYGKEIAENHPDMVERFSLGKSRKNDDIWCLKIGNGSKNAICYACPHPNEPIGAMTVITMAKLFSEDFDFCSQTGMTWYLIPCIDPDSTRLNEGWFKGPFNLYTYARNFYRPSGRAQVEWTFPIDYMGRYFNKPIPETKALMKLMDSTKPAFVFSLHNAAFGGAYWYISKNIPELNPKLENCAKRQNVPLHMGEPEALYIKKYSKAVFSYLSMKASWDAKAAAGKPVEPGEAWCGTCSGDYLDTICDCLALMAELPYFYDERIGDESSSDMTRRDALLENIRIKQRAYNFIDEHMKDIRPLFSVDNPFPGLVMDCVEGFLARTQTAMDEYTGPDFERQATVAEKFDNLVNNIYFDVLNVSLSARACEYELSRDDSGFTDMQRAMLDKERNAFLDELKKMVDDMESNTNYKVIEIKRLVSIQLESALHVIQYV